MMNMMFGGRFCPVVAHPLSIPARPAAAPAFALLRRKSRLLMFMVNAPRHFSTGTFLMYRLPQASMKAGLKKPGEHRRNSD
jgi:hypothetical protein